MWPGELYPQVLRELADTTRRPLSTVFERSRWSGEVSKDWKKVKVTSIIKKGQKGDPGNYSLISLYSIPKKVMEQVILEPISKYMKDKEVIRSRQNWFTVGKSCFSQLIVFYNELTNLMDKTRALDIVHLDFSKVFDTVSDTILVDKLTKYRLGKCTFQWTQNWLNGWAQKVVISGTKTSWRLDISGAP